MVPQILLLVFSIMAVGGHFTKWRPRGTRPGFEMSTLVIFIGEALFYQNQMRHAVLWDL